MYNEIEVEDSSTHWAIGPVGGLVVVVGLLRLWWWACCYNPGPLDGRPAATLGPWAFWWLDGGPATTLVVGLLLRPGTRPAAPRAAPT